MAFEIIDNAVDEAQAGFASRVELVLNGDGSVTVRDDGRGIPTDIHVEEGISAAEVVLTRLHAGGKFNQNSYKVSGGLHGVGAAVVNALSEWMEVRVWRHGIEHFIRFRNGDAEAPLAVVGPVPDHVRGTEVTFKPSPATFTRIEFDFAVLERRLRELAFLNSGLTIVLRDERHPPAAESVLHYEGGLVAFVEWLDRGKTAVFTPPINLHARGRRGGHPRRVRAVVERQLPRDDAVLHQQHPAARRRHASRRLPPGANPRGDEIRRRHGQEGTAPTGRRGHARRHDRGAVGEGAGPEILLADQGQAGVVRGAAGGAGRGGRRRVALVRNAPQGGQARRPEGDGRRRRARGRPQGARTDAPQGRAGRLDPARQARRLPGTRPGKVRDLHRRGRQRRRLRQAGTRPQEPGDPAAERQDPERRARPLRPHARQRRRSAR